MKRKTIFTLIAVILCLSFIGVCYALYTTEANKSFGITAHGGVSLSLNASEGLDISGLSPSKLSETREVKLSVSGSDFDANVKGIFYVELSGDLADGIEVSAQAKDKDSTPSNLTHGQLTNSSVGYQCSLSKLPATVDLTFSLTQNAIQNFANYANKSLSVTVYFKIAKDSVFTPSSNAYYFVKDGEQISKDTKTLTLENGAYVLKGVSFDTNDSFSIYYNGAYLSKVDTSAVNNVARSVDNAVLVESAGTYTVKYTVGKGVSVYQPKTRVYFYNDLGWIGAKAIAIDEGGNPNVLNLAVDSTLSGEYSWFYIDLPSNTASFGLFNGNCASYDEALSIGKATNYFTIEGRETMWIYNGQSFDVKPT